MCQGRHVGVPERSTEAAWGHMGVLERSTEAVWAHMAKVKRRKAHNRAAHNRQVHSNGRPEEACPCGVIARVIARVPQRGSELGSGCHSEGQS